MIEFSLAVSSRDMQLNSVSNSKPSHNVLRERIILLIPLGYDVVKSRMHDHSLSKLIAREQLYCKKNKKSSQEDNIVIKVSKM